jgi:hypothetical protein
MAVVLAIAMSPPFPFSTFLFTRRNVARSAAVSDGTSDGSEEEYKKPPRIFGEVQNSCPFFP